MHWMYSLDTHSPNPDDYPQCADCGYDEATYVLVIDTDDSGVSLVKFVCGECLDKARE